MRNFIINLKTKKKIEVLDAIVFDPGVQIFLPVWGDKPYLVEDIAYVADMQGDQCSLTQHIYVDEEEQSN